MIDPHLLINSTQEQKNLCVLAEVTAVDTAGITLRFEGESAAGQKKYKCINSYSPSAGDRVVVLNIGGSALVLGAVGTYGGDEATTPVCRAYHNTYQSSVSGSYTYLALNSESVDSHGMHDPSSNSSRLTCREAGMYLLVGNIEFGINGSGIRVGLIRLNGTTNITSTCAGVVPAADGWTTVIVTALIPLEIGDYVELGLYQSSGASLSIGQYVTTAFSAVKVTSID